MIAVSGTIADIEAYRHVIITMAETDWDEFNASYKGLLWIHCQFNLWGFLT